jgi:hypothetical protein
MNIANTAVLRILLEDLGKGNFCASFVPHSLTPEQNFLNKIITGLRPGVSLMTPKQSDRVLNGLVRYPSAEETEIPKVTQQDHVENFTNLKPQ